MPEEKNDVASKAKQHLAEQLEKDEAALEKAVSKAQLLGSVVPPPDKWPTCWSCGRKVPLLTRDPMDGVLVCRKCWAISQCASTVEDVGDILEAVSVMLSPEAMLSAVTGQGEEDDPEDNPEDEPEENLEDEPQGDDEPEKGEESEESDEA